MQSMPQDVALLTAVGHIDDATGRGVFGDKWRS